MRLYSDLLSEDELFTDATKFKESAEFPGIYEVDCKLITRKADSIDESAIGGNASAEEAAEDLEDGAAVSGLDVVLDMGYQEVPGGMNKKEYMKEVKKKLEAEDESKVESFMSQAQAAVKGLFIPNIKDLDWFTGKKAAESGEMAMNIACKWNDDGMGGVLYYWKDGLRDEKC